VIHCGFMPSRIACPHSCDTMSSERQVKIGGAVGGSPGLVKKKNFSAFAFRS